MGDTPEEGFIPMFIPGGPHAYIRRPAGPAPRAREGYERGIQDGMNLSKQGRSRASH